MAVIPPPFRSLSIDKNQSELGSVVQIHCILLFFVYQTGQYWPAMKNLVSRDAEKRIFLSFRLSKRHFSKYSNSLPLISDTDYAQQFALCSTYQILRRRTFFQLPHTIQMNVWLNVTVSARISYGNWHSWNFMATIDNNRKLGGLLSLLWYFRFSMVFAENLSLFRGSVSR